MGGAILKVFSQKRAQQKICSSYFAAVTNWENQLWLRFFRAQVDKLHVLIGEFNEATVCHTMIRPPPIFGGL